MYYIMWIFKLRYCLKKFVNSDVLYYLKNYNILQLLQIVLKCLLFRNIFNDQSFRWISIFISFFKKVAFFWNSKVFFYYMHLVVRLIYTDNSKTTKIVLIHNASSSFSLVYPTLKIPNHTFMSISEEFINEEVENSSLTRMKDRVNEPVDIHLGNIYRYIIAKAPQRKREKLESL